MMINTDLFTEQYSSFKHPEIERRYLKNDQMDGIKELIGGLAGEKEIVGTSVQGRPITLFRVGEGKTRVLMWSQMHGNETTTTRALADLIQFLRTHPAYLNKLSDELSLYIIPVLNPDGAIAYTRQNANQVDLNRDAQDLTQPESIVLREVFNQVQPDFCFNLHDQRTIFSAGHQQFPATVSFLSPACNKERSVNGVRKTSMRIIAAMNRELQKLIPGQVGRYDDGFNLDCVGDTFQSEGVPTVLFEAGHTAQDYERLQTRKYIALALYVALEALRGDALVQVDHNEYFDIPENRKLFCDLIIKNVALRNEKGGIERVDVAFQYKETLVDKEITFIPEFDRVITSEVLYAHKYLEAPEPFILESAPEKELKTAVTELLFRILQ